MLLKQMGSSYTLSKSDNEARLVEDKGCFISDAGNWGGWWTSVQRPIPPTDSQWRRAFIDRGRGLHAETVWSALTVILELAIGGLTSVILIVLSAVSFQFQV